MAVDIGRQVGPSDKRPYFFDELVQGIHVCYPAACHESDGPDLGPNRFLLEIDRVRRQDETPVAGHRRELGAIFLLDQDGAIELAQDVEFLRSGDGMFVPKAEFAHARLANADEIVGVYKGARAGWQRVPQIGEMETFDNADIEGFREAKFLKPACIFGGLKRAFTAQPCETPRTGTGP